MKVVREAFTLWSMGMMTFVLVTIAYNGFPNSINHSRFLIGILLVAWFLLFAKEFFHEQF